MTNRKWFLSNKTRRFGKFNTHFVKKVMRNSLNRTSNVAVLNKERTLS